MADKKNHLNNQTKENKNAKSRNAQKQDSFKILGDSALPEKKNIKGSPLKLNDKSALDFFEGEQDETNEIDLGLEKADLTQVEKITTLKSKPKKSGTEEDNLDIKSDIVSVALTLLKVAGTSIAELSNNAKGQKATLTNITPLTSAKEKLFLEQDVSVITHQDVAKFEATKLKSEPNIKEPIFSEQVSAKGDASFLDDAHKPTTQSAPLSNSLQRGDSKKKSGFFHYFGMIIFSLIALGGIGYSVVFITKLLNNDNKSEYTKIQEDLSKKKENEPRAVKVKAPLQKDDPLVDEAKSVIKQFLDAEVKSFARTFIIQNKEITKTFNKYWIPSESYKSEFLAFDKGYTLPNGAKWVSFLYGKENQERQLILIKADDDPFRIDWQAYSEVESIPLATMKEEVKTAPKNIRAWITPAHYYPTGYSDSYWQNYVAKDLEGNTLNCYVPLNTKSSERIFEAIVSDPKPYPKAQKGDTGMYVKLMVRKPQIGAEFVEIMEVLDTTWHKEIED